MPTALMGGDGGEADKEPVMQHVDGKADGARMVRIEAIEQEITALGEDDKKRAARDDGRLDKIGGGDAEHVPNRIWLVLIGLDLGEQHEPEAEHARKHDAHDRVLFYAAVVFQVANESAHARPAANAPTASGMPRTKAMMAMPGRTACEMASPMSDQPFRTK